MLCAGMLALEKNWLGRLDSNQGMPVPKTGALPLGYAPIARRRVNAPCIGIGAALRNAFRVDFTP
jgi:hypothetical protein